MNSYPSSNQNNKGGRGTTGKVLLWVALLLSVALLGFMTVWAVRSNPLYSNAEANGLSKYKFIEQCKDKLADQLGEFAKQPGGAPLGASYNARDIVSSVNEGISQRPPANSTALPPRIPGWSMVSQVKVSREGFASQTVPFGCQYEKDKQVQLQFPLAQQ
ncbi:hypothetical protein FNU79_15410 [Deinococcus detaillensis]|uniref:Uncharacterized protein n=1 Tax=Deinococcus detaillensis TaxID=2592048 RepID=A0A553UN48_9DEIO|nr:hypothetical protein [Deinococcus detaillensis]TSA81391.1 hypothetical protein FNU79_15410 [Deinococcus detaillensis]